MLGFPIPAEIVTAGASALLSAVLSLISIKMKSAQQAHQMLIDRAVAQDNSYDRAAKRGKDKSVRWTRRIIALTVVGAGFVWPLLAPIFDINVTLGWTELRGGFWFFTDPKEHMIWHTVTATSLVITPLVTHTVSAVIGFYFGGSVVENAR